MRNTVQRDSAARVTGQEVRHILDVDSLHPEELRAILELAREMKRTGRWDEVLRGRLVVLVFEKPSLRTRVSFEAAVHRLGGTFSYLAGQDVGLGVRETIADFARTIERYVDGLVARVYRHQMLIDLAENLRVPLINALSDHAHPCQALADALTVLEHVPSQSPRVVFVGDGNNVARSLALVCRYLGWSFRLCCPERYAFSSAFLNHVRSLPGTGAVEVVHDPQAAVRDADVIYTDVWTSMGQEKEGATRRRAFRRFQVNADLLAAAPRHALVMHCLPARRGEEITDDVIDGPRSIVFDQAENRLHAQQALLGWLYGATRNERRAEE